MPYLNHVLHYHNWLDFCIKLDYSPLATAPPNRNHPELYAGAYDRNAYEMRQKVWQNEQTGDSRVSPPPEYPGAPLMNIQFQGPPRIAVHNSNASCPNNLNGNPGDCGSYDTST